jgi:hypothetical protein
VLDEYGGTISPLLITMVILWLAIIFASFRYRAPRNTIVTASFFLAALLISAILYLILDMDTPSSSMTQASSVPFQRVLAQKAYAASASAHSSMTPAERMRAYRRRRREGSFFVRVQLDPPEIDGLVRRKLLRPGQRRDIEALQVAVQGIVYQVLDGV